MTLFVFLYFILIKKDVFVELSHMPACILNQPRPCYNYITASDPSIGIETKLLKPIPISINSHADTFIPIQKLIAQIFM